VPRRDHSWTILIVRARGRATERLHVPASFVRGARVALTLLVCATTFVGWHLQALYGLDGSCATELSMLPWSVSRSGLFTTLAPSRKVPSAAERRRRATSERAARLGLGDRRAAASLLLGLVEPAWRSEAERLRPGDGRLLWPVKLGWFGRGYGSGSGGYHLAVDINAAAGTDVMAAASGIVGYAGHELRGFGNVVLLVHPGGLVTLYGHNQRNLVTAGQVVARGEAIAALGSTGRSMGPHVHFELIHDGRNCDPMALIAPGPNSYRNYEPLSAPIAWKPNAPWPSAVRCARRMPHPQHEHEDEEGENTPGPVAAAGPEGA